MSSSSLREATVTFRGEQFVVRELTFAETLILGGMLSCDPQRALKMHVSFGAVDPPLSEAEVNDRPAALIDELLETIARLTHGAPRRRYRITEIDT